MNLPDGLLSSFWLFFGHAFFWPVFLLALKHAQWWHMRINHDMHVFLGMIVALLLIWTMKAGFAEGLSLHLVGATLFTLMFGWSFAIIGLSAVLLGVTIMGGAGWSTYALNALIMVILPVSTSYAIYYLVDRKLPNHFFIYIFLNAFFGAALAITVSMFASVWIMYMADVYSMEYIVYNFLRYLPLLLFPEAFVTGMLMTMFVLFFPKWVSTFDDARYLRNH